MCGCCAIRTGYCDVFFTQLLCHFKFGGKLVLVCDQLAPFTALAVLVIFFLFDAQQRNVFGSSSLLPSTQPQCFDTHTLHSHVHTHIQPMHPMVSTSHHLAHNCFLTRFSYVCMKNPNFGSNQKPLQWSSSTNIIKRMQSLHTLRIIHP